MSLAQAIFSSSLAAVLQVLFGQPEQSFHLRELQRQSGLASASLQRELRRLTRAGLVLEQRQGNLKLFRANEKSIIFNELKEIVRKTLGLEPLLQAALATLGTRVKIAFVYGSVANGTETAMSDVDVMVISDDLLLSEILEVLMPLEASIGRRINPTCYSQEEFERRRAGGDSFLVRVLAQPVLKLIGDPHVAG